MMKKKNKPKLYFNHKDILNQIQLETPSFCLYLEQNMIEFFHDITDLAECYDAFSVTDYAESKVPYSYDVNI